VSRAERDKGARGEREVAAVLRRHGLPVDRTIQQSGFYVRGDLTGVPGYHFEVKRQETLRVPQWIRQAWADCDDAVPVVVFRTNAGFSQAEVVRVDELGNDMGVATIRVPDALGEWHAILPLADLAKLLDLARLTA